MTSNYYCKMRNKEIERICFRLSREVENLSNRKSCFLDEKLEAIEEAFYEILSEEMDLEEDYVESEEGT